ncbi:MAG TPA: mechanosensitive ion channel domain-containing protein [Devosia sp.]|uniref:mechanosensitive ion channel family protein n=1 Tax=Devosia sp. TaxID=1871048 RepID=UPI002DDD9D6A|nr:mechanosensitive ion channel domain-containing protein [Devosia sp.]HEV2516612.1 mechanosensitive ion channel domain-containing protein [Devosia sp.]
MKQLIAVILVVLSIGSAVAQQAKPTSATPPDAVEQLIVVLEDPVLREQLLEHLRSTPAAATTAPTAEQTDTSGGDGLVGALYRWSDDFVTSLPSATFGVPIDRKLAQAGAQIGSRVQGGLSDGQLLQFIAWALPGLMIVVGIGIGIGRGTRGLVQPTKPVRKRKLAIGLMLKVVLSAAAVLAIAVLVNFLPVSKVAGTSFTSLTVGILLSMLTADLATSVLSAFGSIRSVRLIRYGQRRFYPWWLTVASLATFAALAADPTLRQVVGWSAADFAALILNSIAALTMLAFVSRHRMALGRLIFGSAARAPVSDNPIRNATRRLARHWHIIAYGFLILSIFSLWAGQRDNDVLGQMLWSFAVVLGGLITFGVLHRLTTPNSPRYRYERQTLRQILAAKMLKMVRVAADLATLLAMAIIVAGIWGFDIWGWLTRDGRVIVGPFFAAATVVAVAWLIWVTLDAWIATTLAPSDKSRSSAQRSGRLQTLLPLMRNGVLILLVVLGGIAVLANIGVDVTPLIAGAGVFGLALSFGSQQLVQDVITGFFILAEDTIAVGDTISTGDRTGVVESLSLRSMRLRDSDGALHSIPFSTVKALKNSSRNFGVLRPRFTVPSGTDPSAVMDEMRTAATALRADPKFAKAITSDMHDLGIDEINAGSVVVSGSLRTSPVRQPEIARAFNGRMLAGLAEKGIRL